MLGRHSRLIWLLPVLVVVAIAGTWLWRGGRADDWTQATLDEYGKDPDWLVRFQARDKLLARRDKRVTAALLERLETGLEDEALLPLLHDFGKPVVAMVIDKLGENEVVRKAGDPAVKPTPGDIESEYWGEWGTNVGLLIRVGRPAVPALVAKLKDLKPVPRAYAARALGAMRDASDAVDPLIEALQDTDPLVRRCAAWSLGEIGDTRATAALVLALKDPESSVRIQVAKALGTAGDPAAREALAAMTSDTGSGVPSAAYEALGNFAGAATGGQASAIDPLLDRFLKAEGEQKEEAAWKIVENMRMRYSAALVDCYNSLPPSDALRDACIQGLAKAKCRRAIPLFITAFDDVSPKVRRPAATAFEEVGRDYRAYDGLMKLARFDPDETVRRAAIWTLTSHKDAAVIDALLEFADDPSVVVRRAAVACLGFKMDVRALQRVNAAISDPAEEVAMAALTRVRERPNAMAVKPILDLLNGPNPALAAAALDALTAMKTVGVADVLKAALDDPDENTRISALLGLAKMRDSESFKKILAVYEGSDQRVRLAAAFAMGALGNFQIDAEVAPKFQADFKDITKNHRKYIRQGDESSLAAMAYVLGNYGTESMATDYYLSGNELLKELALRYGMLRNLREEILDFRDDPLRPGWGGAPPVPAVRQSGAQPGA